MKKNFFEYLFEISKFYVFINDYVQKSNLFTHEDYVLDKSYIPNGCMSILELCDRWDIDFDIFYSLIRRFGINFNIGWKIEHNNDEKIRIFMLFIDETVINNIEEQNEQLATSAKKYMDNILLYKSIKGKIKELSKDIDRFTDYGYFYSKKLFYEKLLSNRVLNIDLLSENYDADYSQYLKKLYKFIKDKDFVKYGAERAILDNIYNRYKYLSILSIMEKKYNLIKSNGLLSYLIDARIKGIPDKEIAEALLKKNYSKEVIGAVLRQDNTIVADYSQWLEKSILGIKRKNKME